MTDKNQDAPKVETPKADAPKVEAPKADAPKVEAPKPLHDGKVVHRAPLNTQEVQALHKAGFAFDYKTNKWAPAPKAEKAK